MYRYYFGYWNTEMRRQMCEICPDIQNYGEGMVEKGSDDTTVVMRRPSLFQILSNKTSSTTECYSVWTGS